jgi:hypothetical protein
MGDELLGPKAGALHALLRRGSVSSFASLVNSGRREQTLDIARTLRMLVVPALVDFFPWVRRVWHVFRRPSYPPRWVTEPLRSRFERRQPAEWSARSAAIFDQNLVPALESLERVGLSEGVSFLHPYTDPDLIGFLLTLPPETKFATGSYKSVVRQAYRDRLPPAVLARPKQTVQAVEADVKMADEILPQLRQTPRRLPGVNWEMLESSVREGTLSSEEHTLVWAVLVADAFLGSS